MRKLILLCLLLPTSLFAQVFEVFYVGSKPNDLSNTYNVKYFSVDASERAVQNINSLLKKSGVNNEKDALKFIPSDLMTNIEAGYRSLMTASNYQLSYFPAIVVDKKYVLYGSTNPKDFLEIKKP